MVKKVMRIIAVTLCVCAAAWPVATPAVETNDWQFGASIYFWFPNIAGETAFPNVGNGEFQVDIENVLDNLQFALMGTFDARKGRWGFLTDAIYMDVGSSQTGGRDYLIGGIQVPVTATGTVDFDLKSLIWTLAGYYRAIDQAGHTLDVVGGARVLDVEQKVNWNITGNIGAMPPSYRTGAGEASLTNWDVIIGLRGRFAFGAQKSWFMPYYLDVGTGDSDFTWQGIAGIGYAFHWGEVVADWRYLDYDLASDSAISDMNFSGPGLAATFRW
jgi:hypothetical protein